MALCFLQISALRVPATQFAVDAITAMELPCWMCVVLRIALISQFR
jgi:hypothetical protein